MTNRSTNSIAIPVSLKVQMAELTQQIEKIRSAMSTVKPDSKSYKQLEIQLKSIEREFQGIQKSANTTFSTQGQISTFSRKFEHLEVLVENLGSSFSKLGFSDFLNDSFDKGLIDSLKKVQDNLTQTQKDFKDIGENAFKGFINSSKDVEEVKKLFSFKEEDFSIDKVDATLKAIEKRLKKSQGEIANINIDILGKQNNQTQLNKDVSERISKVANLSDEYDKLREKAELAAEAEKKALKELQSAENDPQLEKIKKDLNKALSENQIFAKGARKGERAKASSEGQSFGDFFDPKGDFKDDTTKTKFIDYIKTTYSLTQEDIKKIDFGLLTSNTVHTIYHSLIEQIQEKLKNLNKKIETEESNYAKAQKDKEQADTNVTQKGNELTQAVDEVNALNQKIDDIRKQLDALEKQRKDLEAGIQTQEQAIKDVEQAKKESSAAMTSSPEARQIIELKEEVRKLKEELLKTNPALKQTSDAIDKVKQAAGESVMKISGDMSKQLEDFSNTEMKLGNIQSAIKRWFSFAEVINITKNAFRDAIQTIQKLDKVITEIAIVTDMTQAELWKQIDTYSQIALQYGVSTEGAYQVSMLWYQQGLKTAEVMELTTETLKMAKIAGLDYATATDYMTVALRGFKLEMTEAQNVTDVYSALAAATASNTQELAVAMSKTASSAEAVGASFESTSAMIATMVSVTRESATNIGSALKSIVSRYGEMTKDPAKLVDSEGEELSLNKVDKALQAVGLSLHDANGQFRDFDDVILELAQKWDTIDRNAQRYIATVFAGNRQQSRFLALVGNYDQYAEALETAANAEGAGTLQTLKTLDSIESKLSQLRTVWEQFYSSLGFEQIFKNGLDFLTNIIKNLNKMNKISVFGNIINIVKSTKKVLSDSFGMIKKSLGDTELSLTKILAKAGQGIVIKVKADLTEFEKPIEEAKNRAQQPVVVNKGNGQPTQIPVAPIPAQTAASTQKTRDSLLAFRGLEKVLSSGWLNQAVGQKANWGMSKILGSGGRDYFSRFNFTDEEYNAFTSLLKNFKAENDKLGKSFQSTSQMLKEFGTALEKTEAQFFKQKRKDARKENWNAFKTNSKESIAGFFSAIAKYGNVIGNAASLIGAAMTTKGLTITDKSTDTKERSKTLSGGGSLIGAAGSIISGAAIGGIPGLIASIITSMPTIIGGISNIIDGMTITTAERIEMLKAETEELKNQATLKKGESDSFKNSLAEYKKLAEAQYDSEEASKAFTEKMNEMAEEYPELISYMDAAGNAIIDAQKAEEKLAKLRYDTAKASNAAAASEYKTKKAQEKEANEIKENFDSIELAFKDSFAVITEERIREKFKLSGHSSADDFIYDYTEGEISEEEQNTLNSLIQALENNSPLSQDDLEFARKYSISLSESEKDKNTAIIDLEDITADMLYDNNAIDVQKKVNEILSYFGKETLTEQLFGEELYQALESAIWLLQGKVSSAEEATEIARTARIQTDLSEFITNGVQAGEFEQDAINYATNYASMLETIGAQIVENSIDEGVDIDAVGSGYTEAKIAAQEALKILIQNASEDIVKIYDNLANYKISDDLESELKNYGLDEETTAAFIELYTERVQAARDRVLSANGGEDFDVLFDGKSENELITSYADFTISTINQIDDYIEDGLTARAAILEETSIYLLSEISKLDSETQTALQPIIKGIDWNDSASLISAIEAIEKYGETSGKTSDLEETLKALNEAKDNLIFNIELGFQNATDLLVESYEEREKLASGLSSGLDFDEMIAESKKIQAKNPELSLDDLFKFDEELGKWVYTQTGFQKTLELQAKEIEEQSEIAKREFEEFSNIANNPFFINNRLFRTKELNIFDEEGKLTETTRNIFSKYFSTKQIGILETYLEDFDESTGETVYEFFQRKIAELAEAEEEWNQALEAFNQAQKDVLFRGLNLEKIASGIVTEVDAEAIRVAAKGTEYENQVGAIITGIINGNYDLFWKLFGLTADRYNEIIESKSSIMNNTIDKYLNGAKKESYTEAEQKALTAIKVSELRNGITDNFLSYFETEAEAIEAYYKIIHEEFNKQFDLASKTKLDDKDVSQLLTIKNKHQGQESELGLERDASTGEWIIKDLELYRSQFDETIQNNTSLWLDSYSEIIENEIEKRNKVPNAIADDINNLLRAKIGEEISLAAISVFSKGKIGPLFTAQSSEDIYKVAQQIYDLAASGSLEIGMSLEELEDSIDDLFNKWIDMINNGIEGSLSNAEAKELKTYFNLNDADFIETAEGLKLTEEATYRIHNRLQIIKPLAAEVTLANLAEKAMESEENLNNIYFVLEKIKKLEKAIDEAGSDNNRKAALQEELKLTEKIRDNLMEAGNAFNFMEQDLPTGMTNPLSAWEGLGQAFEVLDGEDFKAGYIDYTDLYNMISMMDEAGIELSSVAEGFNDEAHTAADLMNAAAAAMVSVDGEVFVDLTKLGETFKLNADGMKEGITDGLEVFAQSQIELLDGQIAFLETIVEQQKIFDELDVEQDGIDFSELLPDPEIGDWDEKQKEVLNSLTPYLDNIFLQTVGGLKVHWKALLEHPELFDDLNNTSQTIITQLISALRSNEGNWTESELQGIVNDILAPLNQGIVIDSSILGEVIRVENSEELPSILSEKLKGTVLGNEEYNLTQLINNYLASNPVEVSIGNFLTFVEGQEIIDSSLLDSVRQTLTVQTQKQLENTTVDAGAVQATASQVTVSTKDGEFVFTTPEGEELTVEELIAKLNLDDTAALETLSAVQTALDTLILPDHVLTFLQQAVTKVKDYASAANSISQLAVDRIGKLKDNLNNMPTGTKTLKVALQVSSSGGVSVASVDGTTGAKGNVATVSLAKGNARAKGTLMGELGPELYATGGHYYVAGQNGAEFVDLPDDAIVFNHLQTRRLLENGSINGTGTAVTSEKKAVTLATGNASGPAMASASDALNQLKEIRAMWQSLLNKSAKDLGKKAGGGSGGSGGGGGSDEENKAFLHDLERWYNLLRQIEKLEQQITYEQAKRANMQSGYKYSDSLQKELILLKKQQAAHQELSDLQREYYDERRKVLEKTSYGELIFTYDEDGLMQYHEEEGKGLDILAELERTDENGKAVRTAEEQVAFLKEASFDISTLLTNADGSKVESNDYQTMMQIFWDGVDGWMDELDSLYDSYNDSMTSVQESIEAQMEIQQEYIDNQLSVEEKLLQAIIDREQAEIDRLEGEKEALDEATSAYIDGLNNSLEKEKQMYEQNDTSAETARLQRQLAILQRSGGSAAEIRSLQDQIDSRLQDAYFQEQQNQIDAIQEASNNQLKKMQEQIDIMNEALEYQKENGLLWTEVYEMMNLWTPEQMLQFIEEFTNSYKENSDLQNQEDSEETQKQIEIYKAGEANKERDEAWADFYKNLNYEEEFKNKHAVGAQAAFNEAYIKGGLDEAKKAAEQYYKDNEKPDKSIDNNSNTDPSITPEDKPTIESGGSNSGKTNSEKKNTASYGYSETTKVVQEVLNALGGYGNLKVDGILGPATLNAIKKFQASVGLTADGIAGSQTLEKLQGAAPQSLKRRVRAVRYKTGGLVDFTGPAWVDGTKSKPEAFLSASDTAMLKSKIFSNSDGSLKALVAALEEITNNTSRYSTETNSEQIIIQNAQVNIQPGTISNDYSARRAGEMALEEMVKIARKTTNRVVSR